VADRARLLLELQGIDHQLASARQRLHEVEQGLADEGRIAAAEAEPRRIEAEARQAQLEQRQHEGTIGTCDQEISRLSALLYGGSVRNLRELESLQHELGFQQQLKRASEDQVLAAMERLESLAVALTDAEAALTRARVERAAERAALAAEQERLQREIGAHEQRRAQVVAAAGVPAVTAYDRLAPRSGGMPVSEVVQGRCSGCRIVLPAMDVQRARRGQELVHCQSCGRILAA
jgi:predicted  nucleic acid-binding Zn-ribbon protein